VYHHSDIIKRVIVDDTVVRPLIGVDNKKFSGTLAYHHSDIIKSVIVDDTDVRPLNVDHKKVSMTAKIKGILHLSHLTLALQWLKLSKEAGSPVS